MRRDKMDNTLLIVSNCQDGVVTNPKLTEFTKQCNDAMWYHIGVRMSDDEFLSLVNHIQLMMQVKLDDKKRIAELEDMIDRQDEVIRKHVETIDHLQNWYC